MTRFFPIVIKKTQAPPPVEDVVTDEQIRYDMPEQHPEITIADGVAPTTTIIHPTPVDQGRVFAQILGDTTHPEVEESLHFDLISQALHDDTNVKNILIPSVTERHQPGSYASLLEDFDNYESVLEGFDTYADILNRRYKEEATLGIQAREINPDVEEVFRGIVRTLIDEGVPETIATAIAGTAVTENHPPSTTDSLIIFVATAEIQAPTVDDPVISIFPTPEEHALPLSDAIVGIDQENSHPIPLSESVLTTHDLSLQPPQNEQTFIETDFSENPDTPGDLPRLILDAEVEYDNRFTYQMLLDDFETYEEILNTYNTYEEIATVRFPIEDVATVEIETERYISDFDHSSTQGSGWSNPQNIIGNNDNPALLSANSSGIGGISSNTTGGILDGIFTDFTNLEWLTIKSVDVMVNFGASTGGAPVGGGHNVQFQARIGTETQNLQLVNANLGFADRLFDITDFVDSSWARLNSVIIRGNGSVTSGTGLGVSRHVSYRRAWLIATASRESVVIVVHLYDEGTHEDDWVTGLSFGSGSQSKEPDHLFLYTEVVEIEGMRSWRTNTAINLDQIETIEAEIEQTATENAASTLSVGNSTFTTTEAEEEFTNSFPRQTVTLDVSDLIGNHFVRLANFSVGAGAECETKVFRVTLIGP